MEGAKFESYYLKSNYYVYQRNSKDAFPSPEERQRANFELLPWGEEKKG